PQPRPATALLQRRPEPAAGRGAGGDDARRVGRAARRPGPLRREAAAARPPAARRVLRPRGGRHAGGGPARPVAAERAQLAASHPAGAVRVHPPHAGPSFAPGVDRMTTDDIPDDLKDLIDDYLAGLLDEAGVRALEDRLRGDAGARRYFARYCRLHTDLHLEVRARRVGERALRALGGAGG